MAAPAPLHAGIVKAVLSGDSIIVMGVDASKGPPPEKLLSLSGIQAPRLGNKSTADAPFAWDAREFLRKLTVGKRVSFQVEAQGAANRAFGLVFLEDGSSLAHHIVAAGWAKPKSGAQELLDAGVAAEAEGLGMYNPIAKATAVRDVKWAGSFDPAALAAQVKGVPQDAIIEQVPNGSTMRVLLLSGYYQVTLMLSGIQCAGFRRNDDGTEEAQPFAREARYFVETRLLNREVQVLVEGVDKNGSLLGTILHPNGNISVELVKVGLARVVDWSSQMCAAAPQLRAAERAAKDKRLRLWKDYVPPNHGGDMGEFQAKVVEVVSGDTIVVAEGGGGSERRFSLASLRCPRMGREPEPYAAESKENLRKMLIGKKVKVTPEYKRTFPTGEGQAQGETRTFVTVTFNNDRNAGMAQLQDGLALVMKHGGADERSVHYETMLETEDAARAAKRGMHAAGDAPHQPPVADLTKPDARDRAKRFLGSLQRHGKVRGVVQFIPNGTRFKVLIPKEHCVVSFACVGMRCPQCGRRDTGTPGEPYGDEALAFARGLTFQRDVDIEVETIDKNGNFLGSLYLPDKRNYGVMLLEAGLARLVQPMAERSSNGVEMAAAERLAKKQSLKVWENYSEEEEEAARAAAAAMEAVELEPVSDADKQVVELELTEIVDGGHFYAQVAGDAAVTALQEQLAAACKGGNGSSLAPFEPKVGAHCCAKFSQDDEWYRARITSKSGGEFTVFFLDYGNSDVLKADRLKPLPPTLGPKEMSPQALECKLAYTIALPPTDGGDGEEAAHALSEAAWGKAVLARVEERQGETLLVTLTHKGASINDELIEAGLLRVSKDAPRRAASLVKHLREREEVAKKGRYGMWRYGEIDDDECLEFGTNRQKADAAKAAANPTPSAWGKK